MSRAGRPSVVRGQQLDAARDALAAAGQEAFDSIYAELRPIFERLTNDVAELKDFSAACIDALRWAAEEGSVEAVEFLRAIDMWHGKRRRARLVWRALKFAVTR